MNKSKSGRNQLPAQSLLCRSILSGFAAWSMGVAPQAFAQTQPAPSSQTAPDKAGVGAPEALESVTITARKVEEKEIDVPVSVQVFTAKEIQAAQILDLYDLKERAGYNFVTNSPGAQGRSNGSLIFRGLQGGTALVGENSGSVFIDGMFISSGQASLNTTDAARIEVLKGPQNTYFGRSTFGGAINFITKTPATDGLHVSGNVSGATRGAGYRDSHREDVTVEGPLVPNLLYGRVVLYDYVKGAQYRASDGGDLGVEKSRGVIGTLYATPTTNTWLRGRVNFQKDEDGAAPFGFYAATGNTSCNGVTKGAKDINGNPIQYTPGVPYFCGSIPGYNASIVDSQTSLPAPIYRQLSDNFLNDQFLAKAPKLDHVGLVRNVWHGSAQAGIVLPLDMELVVSGGYNQSNQVSAYDSLDASARVNNFFNIQTILAHDTTLDARLSTSRSQPIRGLIGVSYFEQVYQLDQDDLNSGLGATNVALNTGNFANNKSKVPAAYGSVEWDILPNLTASVEVRYQQDRISSLSYDASARYDNKKSNWLPRGSIRFKPMEDLMVYASAAQGVQPLTLNTGFISANAAQRSYIQSVVPGSSEFTPQPKVNTYEVGVKQLLLDKRLQYALTYYDSRWNNRLTFSNIFNTPGVCPANIGLTAACPLPISGIGVYYANNARIKGVELELDALVMRNWTAGVTGAFTNARWLNYYNASQSSTTNPAVLNRNAYYFDGNQLGKQPKWTGSANTTYRVPDVFRDFGAYARADVLFTGKSYESDYNYAKVDSLTRVNVRGGVENKAYTVELYVKNLFNEKGWAYAYRNTNFQLVPLTSFSQQGVQVVPTDPREVGVRVSYRY